MFLWFEVHLIILNIIQPFFWNVEKKKTEEYAVLGCKSLNFLLVVSDQVYGVFNDFSYEKERILKLLMNK